MRIQITKNTSIGAAQGRAAQKRAAQKRAARKRALRRLISIGSVTLTMLVIVCFSVSARAGREQAIEVTVRPGDTLWAIAERYGDRGVDIREIIYNIKRLNGLQSSAVAPGQVLKVPVR